MRPRVDSFTLLPSFRVVFVAAFVVMISGWTTCAVFFSFNSCPGSVPPPQITSLSPDTISLDATPVLLTVNGNNFVPQSQVLWNGTALATTFLDSQHLQIIITETTLASLGISARSNVQISAMSPATGHVVGCPNSQTSAALVLVIS